MTDGKQETAFKMSSGFTPGFVNYKKGALDSQRKW